ncbi:ketopantoate reductase family protein, partial [Rhizobiaceae sp. 2RAB30]
MAARILVWGAGAIGGTVGAYLARAGHDVTFVDAASAHVDAMNRHGLRIVGPVDQFTVGAPA